MANSINDLWVAYLEGLGYSGSLQEMMRQGLVAHMATPPDASVALVDVFKLFFEEKGYPQAANEGLYAYLEGKGYTDISVNDRLKRCIEAGDFFEVAPPSCTSCLGAWTGDIAASVGGTALDVSGLCGHTISTPVGSSSGLYFASSPVVSPVSPTWLSSELRVFENEFIQLADTTGKNSSLSFGIVKIDFSASIFVWAEYDGTSTKIKVVGIPFNAASPIELPALQKAGTPDRVAVGVAGNGDIFILHGSLYAKSINPWSGGFLPFQSMRSDLQGAWTGTAQTEVHTDSAEMTIVYPDMSADGITAVKDFCGNVVS